MRFTFFNLSRKQIFEEGLEIEMFLFSRRDERESFSFVL
jgi:hypothetical protein